MLFWRPDTDMMVIITVIIIMNYYYYYYYKYYYQFSVLGIFIKADCIQSIFKLPGPEPRDFGL